MLAALLALTLNAQTTCTSLCTKEAPKLACLGYQTGSDGGLECFTWHKWTHCEEWTCLCKAEDGMKWASPKALCTAPK